MMADNQLLNDNNNDGDGVIAGGDDIFVYTGGDQEVPDNVRRLRIAENVDTIAERTFEMQGGELLIEVEGHEKLKKIEKYAFYGCPFEKVTKMQGLIEIGECAFGDCPDLSELELGKLEIVGKLAFLECCSLKSVNMPSVRLVEGGAFMDCTALTDAVFGKDLEGIPVNTFAGCDVLRRIVIPLNDNFTVGNSAFNSCEKLSRVDVVVGGIHETISSLHLETWRNEMKGEIDGINQTLPTLNYYDKTQPIQQWITRVFSRMEHYKSEHQILLKEAMTLLELALWKAKILNEADDAAAAQEGVRVTRGRRKRARKDGCITCGASIVIKNVLPFLALK
jgi:hypothetical protein